MLAPPLPADESGRLAALRSYHILDTPPERAFERISQLAARIFEVPICLVSLVDADRQWLKSCVGLDLRQTDRRVSFCAYTILHGEGLVIPDATQDARFCQNPLVTGEPGIRFYAGAPLSTREGFNLGSLCVIDTKPRAFGSESYASLKDLAEIVVDELEFRRASWQLREEVAIRAEAEKRLAELAARDALTGLHNRSVLNERLEAAIQSAKLGRPAALLYVDLDTFKIVNDTLGHGAGDRLLVKVADLLRKCTRPEDTVTRFGGDEFAVILADVGREQALEVSERLRKQFERLSFSEAGRAFAVGASIGVALIEGSGDREHLLANADAACYAAKARGRGRVELYQDNPEELQRLRTDSDMVAKVNAALREQRLLLCFQPVVNLQTRETEFYEALLRLRTEAGTLLPAKDFLPAATRFGLIEQIDREVVRLAAATLQTRPGLRLFVNLSAKAFNNRALLDEVRITFSEAGVTPDRVIFEIIETEVIRNLSLARELIAELQALGFRFALDDFGSGASNLAYLRTLPLDFIKIDGSFVRDIVTDPTYRGFVKAIYEIAGYLRVQTLGRVF